MARSSLRVPGYRVEELIGAGSSGEVWRATVAATGVPVALKRIWLSERGQREAALAEAAVLSGLDHAHLMKLHRVHRHDDAIVLALDLAGGGSLADLLARRGRLTVGETVTAIAPIGGALAYAHTAGVIHGDVSAANILFTDIGLPLLGDLGVARLLGDRAPARTTPAYVDPMVATGGVPTPDSDLFMLAGVALHALTGAPTWQGDDARLVFGAAADADPDFAARLEAAGVPDAVTRVVARALELDPARRGTATEFALELRRAAQPVAVELTAGRSRHTAVRSPDSWPLESVPLATGAAVAAGAGAAPPFARPPLTDGVRAPAPFGTGGRHHRRRSRRRQVMTAVASLAVAGAVAAAGLAALGRPASTAPRGAAVEPAPQRSASVPVTSRPPVMNGSTAAATRPAPARAGRPAAAARTALVGLDSVRSRAYATRDPALLAEIYSSADLIARDRAQLLALVPPGCGLRGVHTAFGAITAARLPSALAVRAHTAISASTLRCAGRPAGHARSGPPMTVTLRLVATARGYRIAAEGEVSDRAPSAAPTRHRDPRTRTPPP